MSRGDLMVYYGDDGNTYNLTECVTGQYGHRKLYKINESDNHFAKIFLDKLSPHDYLLMGLSKLDKNGEIAKFMANIPQVILYHDKELSKRCGYTQ